VLVDFGTVAVRTLVIDRWLPGCDQVRLLDIYEGDE